MSEALVFTWPVCNCHVEDGHRKLIAKLGESTVLDICQNALWLAESIHSNTQGPQSYAWRFHLAEPSAEWHAVVGSLEG